MAHHVGISKAASYCRWISIWEGVKVNRAIGVRERDDADIRHQRAKDMNLALRQQLRAKANSLWTIVVTRNQDDWNSNIENQPR